MMARAVTLFPEPDSPTIASVLPLATENVTPSTACDEAVLSGELDVQIVDGDVRLGRAFERRLASPAASCDADARIHHGVQQVDDEVGDDDDRRRHAA